MSLYHIASGPMQTTASFATLATGTSIITILQVKPFNLARIVEWGYSTDVNASATAGRVELIETDVAATVTASADVDVSKHGPNVADVAVASVAGLTLGTSATGYNSSSEGSITAVRNLALPQQFIPTSQPTLFVQQFPLGREPVIQIAKFGRIRFKLTGAGVNVTAYMVLDI